MGIHCLLDFHLANMNCFIVIAVALSYSTLTHGHGETLEFSGIVGGEKIDPHTIPWQVARNAEGTRSTGLDDDIPLHLAVFCNKKLDELKIDKNQPFEWDIVEWARIEWA